jgi:FkbM family methyltransferase
MLFNQNSLLYNFNKLNIPIKGVLHVGAHECEENAFYQKILNNNDNIIWIEALNEKVEECKKRGIKNIYNYVISDKDNEDIVFQQTNNNQSSSILELGTHLIHHPHIHVTNTINMKTTTLNTFIKENNINSSKLNFWNFDIQGAELKALKGATNIINYADIIYLEVNEEELYKGCPLITEIDDFLKEYNFTRIATEMTEFKWGDAIYVKNKYLKNNCF